MNKKILFNEQKSELPLQLNVSFKKVYDLFVQFSSDDNKQHPFYTSALTIKKEIEKYPFLVDGFSDFSLLKKHEDIINLLLDPLFPELLQTNEIKAASIPFSFESFKFTKRFQDILNNAGDSYEFSIRNFPEDMFYIQACSFILNFYYGFKVDLKRPFYFDIPDTSTGLIKHYRVAFNGDFSDITKTENAPEITQQDYHELLNNFDNIAIWKEKFPPNSYIFKGFGIINLFDVTADESIAGIRSELLKPENDFTTRIEKRLQDFFEIPDLRVGLSVYDFSQNSIENISIKKNESLIIPKNDDFVCNNFFCDYIAKKAFLDNETIAISSVEKYGENNYKNGLYQQLTKENIGSILIIPILSSNKRDMVLIEIASHRPYELNSINQHKLADIIPAFQIAVERSSAEFANALEALIQENYTSIHPTVKWRFLAAAENYQKQLFKTKEDVKVEDIVFNEVYPLYGQSDIKGSSEARNQAIQEDLTTQLNLAISVLKQACETEKLPIYNELMFRVYEYLSHVKLGLNAGDEIDILSFLKREIYPVFNHIQNINSELKKLVDVYMNRLDPKLQVVYEKRKAYENSVTVLNNKLTGFIDKKQKEAQEMFPHYFERYKTDGVEYNMYIGQSLVNNKKFNELHLYNLKLWQLQLMYDLENLALNATHEMEHQLRVASLILVHSNPLAIKYRMDEKKFDVDGAYNIRYEIIKKRIDKAHIKGTNERLTVPGKITIVYSQDKDALEYVKYIKYLQSKNQLGTLEFLELEDLQGVSGLKALRVEVIYNQSNKDKTITLDELMSEFK